MPHYLDPQDSLHWLESEEYTHLLPVGSILITDAEADAWRAPPPETPEEAAKRLERAVELHMDTVAASKGYDDRKTCALRAGYPGPWQAEGQAFGEWMDACWVYCYQVQADVLASVRPLPTEAELIAEFPAIFWPIAP